MLHSYTIASRTHRFSFPIAVLRLGFPSPHPITLSDRTSHCMSRPSTGEQYTREAGVRNFERKVAAVCRAAAVKMVESGVAPLPTPDVKTTPGVKQDGNAIDAVNQVGAVDIVVTYLGRIYHLLWHCGVTH